MRRLFAYLSLALAFIVGGSIHSPAQARPQQAKPPVITSINPVTGVVGASVTVFGTNFGTSQGSVTFNGNPASVVQWTDYSIVAKVPSGNASGNVVATVASTPSNAVAFKVVTMPTTSIVHTNFGFQCGFDPSDCGGPHGSIIWPQSTAQPEFLRLHDVSTSWSDMSTGPGAYDWTALDTWLDVIAQHQPVNVIEVFSWVPCWDAPTCEAPGIAPTGTNSLPLDFSKANGSTAFNDFVTQFTQHCSTNGNCAGNCPPDTTCKSTNLIRYYELWNEWNTTVRWSGTINELYEMLAPAVPIIRANVKNAVILTPSTTSGNNPVFLSWLNLETTNGRLSDWVVWHDYLKGRTPEAEWSMFSSLYLSNLVSLSAWKSYPWADTETNFNVDTFACPDIFNAEDCTGQVVRWQLINSSNGAQSLNWYKWMETIEANSQYKTAYNSMAQFLMGGKFAGPCAATGSGASAPWTCSFTESSGVKALWVWTTSEAGASYTVPTGYVDYLDLTGGAKTTIDAGQAIPITTIPIILEQ